MTTLLDARWTPEQEDWLAENWGKMPLRDLAKRLTVMFGYARTETAVLMRARRLKLGSPIRNRSADILTAFDLVDAFGLSCYKVAKRLLDDYLPTFELWEQNRPTKVVHVKQLQSWLRNPRNWFCLDVTKIQDPRFSHLVRAVRRRWDDEWMTTGEACEVLGYTQQGISKLIWNGRLPAKRHGNWWVLRSDVEQIRKENLCQLNKR